MRKITTFLATCLLTVSLASAQQTMSITNGSFEQWTTTQGYSVMGTIQLFDSYITPTGWHTMKYPLDTSFNYMELIPVSIQTDIPLQIMDKDTSGVPDGNYGAMLQTFQIIDILSGVAQLGGASMLGGFDTVTMPTILSLGELETEPTMELMSVLPNIMTDPTAMAMLDTLDFSRYSTGGMDLNGFNVGKLTGKYKYEPATNSNDVGGVILIGSMYEPVSGKRLIVGGGMNTNLSHQHAYTDFEVAYMSLSDDPNVAPDKLEIIFLSSAGTTTTGSKLFIDAIELSVADDESIETASNEPNFSIYPNPSKGNVYLDINGNESVNVRIFNQLGQTVAQRTNCTGKVSFNLPTAGLYVMEVSNSTFRSVKQVVVTK
ncbi:MAG: T9SS type A sorting domain-containing protein [Bacteroidales bacterium]|nr:T9SS type A sorting domain-containing protein [Bacteroidales bacterium]